jgi:RNA polymerase sigma factor (sigma-70 family)
MKGVGAMTQEELERLLEGLHRDCYGWALACCRWNRDEALEVLQTAYVRVIEGAARLNGFPAPRAWLFGVIRRTALERRRRRAVRALGLLRWQRLSPARADAAGPAAEAEEGEARARLRRLLDRLSSRQRDLLHLVFYQDMTIEEAAGVLAISLGTARVHYERGKARLRRLLSEEQVTRP